MNGVKVRKGLIVFTQDRLVQISARSMVPSLRRGTPAAMAPKSGACSLVENLFWRIPGLLQLSFPGE